MLTYVVMCTLYVCGMTSGEGLASCLLLPLGPSLSRVSYTESICWFVSIGHLDASCECIHFPQNDDR